MDQIYVDQQKCKKCGRLQYFEYSVKDEIWELLPAKWHSRVLCVDCFIEEMDSILDDDLELTLDDFDFIGLVGRKISAVILDRNPKGGGAI